MSVLRRWAVINSASLAVGVIGALALGTGVKIAAEPVTYEMTVLAQAAVIAGAAWLLLAIARFVVLQREEDR